jgi:hypothetical protein
MLYSQKYDRIMVARDDVGACVLASLDSLTLKPMAIRFLKPGIEPMAWRSSPRIAARGASLLVQTGFSNTAQTLILVNAKTLKTTRQFTAPDIATDIACIDSLDLIVLVYLHPTGLNGSKPRLVLRRLGTTRVIASQPINATTFGAVRLFVDETRKRVIVVDGDGHFAMSYSLPGLRSLGGISLSLDSLIHLWSPRSQQLICQSMTGNCRSVQVTSIGSGSLRTVSGPLPGVDGPEFMAVDDSRGYVFVGANNAVHAIPIRAKARAWVVRTGAKVDWIKVDRKQHRLLVEWLDVSHRLTWITKGKAIEIHPKEKNGFNFFGGLSTAMAGVNFASNEVLVSGRYGSFWLSLSTLKRRRANAKAMNLRFATRKGRIYGLSFPENTDMDEPKAEVVVFDRSKPSRRIAIGKMPADLLYAEKADKLFLLRDDRIEQLHGSSARLPDARPFNAEFYPKTGFTADVNPTGRVAYFVPANKPLIYKLRLPDGAVLGARRLNMVPRYVALEEAGQTIYLADDVGGVIETIRTF